MKIRTTYLHRVDGRITQYNVNLELPAASTQFDDIRKSNPKAAKEAKLALAVCKKHHRQQAPNAWQCLSVSTKPMVWVTNCRICQNQFETTSNTTEKE
jgi:hypothetical protein